MRMIPDEAKNGHGERERVLLSSRLAFLYDMLQAAPRGAVRASSQGPRRRPASGPTCDLPIR